MVIPGYDPEDLDDTLEAHLHENDVSTYLSDDEWDAYQRGDESLIDLLDGSEIEQLLDRSGVSLEETE